MIELARSAPYVDLREKFEPLDSVLLGSSQAERASLRRVIAEVVSIGSVLPIDLNVLQMVTSIQDEHAMTLQDAMMFAAVLADLETARPKVSCFLNRNTRDFDDPGVLAKLRICLEITFPYKNVLGYAGRHGDAGRNHGSL